MKLSRQQNGPHEAAGAAEVKDVPQMLIKELPDSGVWRYLSRSALI